MLAQVQLVSYALFYFLFVVSMNNLHFLIVIWLEYYYNVKDYNSWKINYAIKVS